MIVYFLKPNVSNQIEYITIMSFVIKWPYMKQYKILLHTFKEEISFIDLE